MGEGGGLKLAHPCPVGLTLQRQVPHLRSIPQLLCRIRQQAASERERERVCVRACEREVWGEFQKCEGLQMVGVGGSSTRLAKCAKQASTSAPITEGFMFLASGAE